MTTPIQLGDEPLYYNFGVGELFSERDDRPIGKDSIISVCAWHGQPQVRNWIVKAGYRVSDSICEQCAKTMKGQAGI